MKIDSHALLYSNSSPTHDLIEPGLSSEFLKLFIEHLHFGACKCSKVETNLSWTCLVSGLFEFRTSLGTSIFATVVAHQQGSFTHSDIWSRVILDLHWFNIFRPVFFMIFRPWILNIPHHTTFIWLLSHFQWDVIHLVDTEASVYTREIATAGILTEENTAR